MIDNQLTDRVTVAMRGETVEVACVGTGPVVVALIPGAPGIADITSHLSLTHRRTGMRLQLSPEFAPNDAGLSAALALRDSLLELPMNWDVDQPDPKADGCIASLRDMILGAHDAADNSWDEVQP
jgi:hypothetical protein